MSSHGVPRGTGEKPTTDRDRRRELQKINDYKGLVESVASRIRQHQYSTESLELTSKLLRWNPEYYTIWNHRRLIMQHLLSTALVKNVGIVEDPEAVANFISDDLAFLIPLLRKFPKCYWIWNYRLWLLEQATRCLALDEARSIWQQELLLAGKMLSLDSRNFLGWGYRRTVIAALESDELLTEGPAKSMTGQEFEYTTKMINSNLSNFSAWHNRSKLIPRLLDQSEADGTARRKFLDDELELIQRALWADSDDQSLWFYHQHLVCTFDPKYAAHSMAPQLTTEERSKYITQETERIREMLDGAEDCKWIYQALIHLSTVYKDLNGDWPKTSTEVAEWADELAKIDPLRAGRWNDLKIKI